MIDENFVLNVKFNVISFSFENVSWILHYLSRNVNAQIIAELFRSCLIKCDISHKRAAFVRKLEVQSIDCTRPAFLWTFSFQAKARLFLKFHRQPEESSGSCWWRHPRGITPTMKLICISSTPGVTFLSSAKSFVARWSYEKLVMVNTACRTLQTTPALSWVEQYIIRLERLRLIPQFNVVCQRKYLPFKSRKG